MAGKGTIFDSASAKLIAQTTRQYRQDFPNSPTPPDQSQPLNVRDDENYVLKIDSPASGGGKYWLKLLKAPTSDISDTGDLAESDFGTAYTPTNTATKYLGLNTPEVGQSTHALDNGTIVRATLHRHNTNGIIVMLITGYGLADCDAGSSSGSSTP